VSDYTPSEIGMREFLNSEILMRVVDRVGEGIMVRAIAMAPVGDPSEDEHPGRYKASFRMRSHRFGGATNDRVEAIVYNDSPEAVQVEFGHRGREPYHTLLRAASEASW
jgi:hypothetical protein